MSDASENQSEPCQSIDLKGTVYINNEKLFISHVMNFSILQPFFAFWILTANRDTTEGKLKGNTNRKH